MKNVYEVLRQKEMELSRLEKEVEALRLVAPLLSEGMENSEMAKSALPTAVNGPQQAIRIPAPPVVPAAQPVRAAGWDVVERRTVADGADAVAEALRELCGGFAGIVVTTGGTGPGSPPGLKRRLSPRSG